MAEVVEVASTVRFRCWNVPNFATINMPARPREEGFTSLPTVPVAELDQAALDALVAAWIGDLYSKAAKDCPWEMRDAS